MNNKILLYISTFLIFFCFAKNAYAQGSVGNYVWSDSNNNGLQDDGIGVGINGLTIELWKETSSGSGSYTLFQSTTSVNDGSGNAGYYNFVIAANANYKVKFPITSGTKALIIQTSTAGTDDNSDALPADGFSPVFAINITGSGFAKNNTTIDAGYGCNTFWIKASNSALVMQVTSSSTIAGASIFQENGNDNLTSQAWQFINKTTNNPVVSLTSGNIYYIKNVNSGMYIQKNGGNSVTVIQNPLTVGNNNFEWIVSQHPVNGGWYITSVNDPTMYLCVNNASNGSSPIVTYAPGSSDNTYALYFLLPTCTTCNITIPRVTVSGCYQVAGVSKATVEVEVGWSAVRASNITVTLDGQTRDIKPLKSLYSPINGLVANQVVAFEVDATGLAGTVTANFDNVSSCTATANFTIPSSCNNLICSGTILGGMVFNDYDANGVKNTAESTSGVGNVEIVAVDNTGVTYNTTTNNYGKYILGIPTANYPIRIEWTPPIGYGKGTQNGTNGKTSVQFVSSASCNIDFGLLQNNDYCQSNPKIVVPVFRTGDPSNATVGSLTALYRYDKTLTGAPAPASMDNLATIAQIGAVWGTVYDPLRNKIYTASVVRRHSAMGPLGIDGIYQTNLNAALPNASKLLEASDYSGVLVGTIETTANRNIVGPATSTSTDTSGWNAVGLRGFGGIQISDDGNELWVMNLYQKELLKFNLNNLAAGPTRYPVPNPGCVGGTYRPWSVKLRDGKVFVGVVCDASTSLNKSNLRAFIYPLTIATGTWGAQIMEFPLNYPKGAVANGSTFTGWYPWSNDFNSKLEASVSVTRPEPILASIEFDIDGSMVLAFIDRTVMMVGWGNVGLSGTNLYNGYSGGDLLRAFYQNGTYILENNAKAGPVTGAGANNNQGPGFGEFYADGRIGFHPEGALGGLALQPGSGEVLAAIMDPGDYYSNGTTFFNNSTGLGSADYRIFVTQSPNIDGTMSKAAGLGDVEFTCALPTYLEIGNRVWADTDSDGIQDPNEAGMNGIEVRLYNTAGTLVGITTTNTSGEYYFNQTNIDNTGVSIAGVPNTSFSGLAEATQYYIVIGKNATFNTTLNELVVGGVRYFVTSANTGEGTTPDVNDNDATLASGIQPTINGFPYISVLTGAAGNVNHTYDFGFKLVCNVSFTLASSNVTCNGASNAQITVTTTSGTAPFMYSKDAGITYQSSNVFTGLAPGTYPVWVKDVYNCVKSCN